jgi:hypothetical protein
LRKSEKGWSWRIATFLKAAGLVAASGAGVFWYASTIEPYWLQWKTVHVKLPGLDPAFNGFRLVQLSDLHFHEHGAISPARMTRIVRHVNRWQPDAILITGDFVTKLDNTSRACISTLVKLKAKSGVYGITGNHDYWTDAASVTALAEAVGVRMLCNAHVLIRRKQAALAIAGVDNIWEGQPDLAQALHGIDSETPTILMAHESNYADVVDDARVKLQLSGHTHGGQVRIPLLGPLALPDIGYRYPMGFYRIPRPVGELLLYVNRGVGVAEIPLRLFCRPEVTLFILETAS